MSFIFRLDNKGGDDRFVNVDHFCQFIFHTRADGNDEMTCYFPGDGTGSIILRGEQARQLREYLNGVHISSSTR